MNPLRLLPPLPGLPRPPLFRGEEEEEPREELPKRSNGNPDKEFRSRLKSEGFDPELIEMGVRVANNHSRSREAALKIGETYVREMAK